jgi:hypothetical protein
MHLSQSPRGEQRTVCWSSHHIIIAIPKRLNRLDRLRYVTDEPWA